MVDGEWRKVRILKKNPNGSLRVDGGPGIGEFDIGGPPKGSGIKLRVGQKLEVEVVVFYCFNARTLTRSPRSWRM